MQHLYDKIFYPNTVVKIKNKSVFVLAWHGLN